MNNYLLLFRTGRDVKAASPEQLQGVMTKWQLWLSQLENEKRLVAGQRLVPTGKLLGKAKMESIDGPFTEGKEIVGGYHLIKASSLEDAVAVARGCPIFDFGGSVEVRETVVN